jgi:two-component system cell cycle sensor histidine kinase/response regulator CckA
VLALISMTSRTIASIRENKPMAIFVAIICVALGSALVGHDSEAWRSFLDAIDGPVLAVVAFLSIMAIGTARRESRKAAAQAIRARNEYSRLFADAPVAFFRTSEAGEILAVNPATHALLGVPPSVSLVGSNVRRWYANPGERETFLRALRAGTVPAGHILNLRRYDGTDCWAIVSARVIQDPETGAKVIDGSLSDVTEHRRATMRLQASESRFRAITEKGADGITLFGRDGIVTYRSGGAVRLLGLSSGNEVGGSFLDRVHPEDRARVHEVVREVLAHPGNSRLVDLRLFREDGTQLTAGAQFTNLLDEPTVSAIVINFRDISDRVRTSTALRESESRFREIAEHIKEAFFDVEIATGKILYQGPTWSEIWGRPMSEGYDADIWFDSVHPDDQASIVSSQASVKAGRSDEATFRVLRPDGATRWVRARVFPVLDSTGLPCRLVGVAEDVTALHHAEEQFIQAQKMEAVGRLAGGVAHDFNNLLTVVLAEAEFTRAMMPNGSSEAESLENIRDAAQKAATLTRQLLLFSRKQLSEPVTLDLNDVVTDTGKLLRRLIGEDIRLDIVLNPEAAIVRVDRGHLDQVLTNLAVNARDAMPNGGEISVEVATETVSPRRAADLGGISPGSYVTILVSDTGHGIPAAIRDHIFEPFFTTKESGKGTGLGLATCLGIVEQAGGHIEVASRIGIGTEFTIYLPRIASASTTDESSCNVEGGSESILLVEDEEGVRRVATRILRGLGYDVSEACDVPEALGVVKHHGKPFDLLLTDVVLPGLGGRDLAEFLSASAPQTKVLFVTGYTNDVLLQQRLEEHDAAILQKPYTRETLGRRVREALDLAPVAA